MRRRLLAALLLAGLLPVSVAAGVEDPLPEAEGAAAGESSVAGSATTGANLLGATIDGPAGASDVLLGAAVADATTAGTPFASAALTGLAAGGTTVNGWEATSDAPSSGSVTVPLSAPPLDGELRLLDWVVEADADSATAEVAALEGDVGLGAIAGLTASLGQRGLAASVTPDLAGAGTVLTVGGLDVGAGDLVPADVLAALPIAMLADLAAALGLPVDPAIADVGARLFAVADTAADVRDTAAVLDAAVAALAPFQAAVDDLAADLADAEAVLAAPTLAGVTDLVTGHPWCGVVVDPLDLLGAATAVRDCLAAALATAQAELDAAVATAAALQAALDQLLADLAALLAAVPDLADARAVLLAAVADAPLLTLDGLALAVETAADALSGMASATCDTATLTVAGSAVGAPSCDALAVGLGAAADAVLALLDALPLADKVPVVTMAAPMASTSASPGPDANGTTFGDADLTALVIDIPSLTLAGVVDTVLVDTRAILADLVANGPALPADVSAAIAGLDAALGGLPLGDALEGLRTVGLGVTAGGLTSSSTFTVTNVDPDPPTTTTTTTTTTAPEDTTTTTPATPESPEPTLPTTTTTTPKVSGPTITTAPPSSGPTTTVTVVTARPPGSRPRPVPSGTLPRTGSDPATLVAVALVLLGWGWVACEAGRRERATD